MRHSVMLLMFAVVIGITIYIYMLAIRVLLSWFPNIDWLTPPFSILSQLTDPYLKMFHSAIPSLNGTFDISPILAVLLLQVLSELLISVARGI